MVRHNVNRILTFNMSDSSRFVAISPKVLYFPLSTIQSLAAQRLAEFPNTFFQDVLQRRSPRFPAPRQVFPRKDLTYDKKFVRLFCRTNIIVVVWRW